jgi:SAM-dependent methyltransferase
LSDPLASDRQSGKKRLAILIADAGAPSELRGLLDRVPEAIRGQVAEVLAFEGSSQTDIGFTPVGRAWPNLATPLSVFRSERDLGAGGRRIRGFKHALKRGHDFVAVLRRDGRDPPEALPELLAALESGAADAVFATQATPHGSKSLGYRALARIERTILGTSFGDLNPGYRLYSCDAIKRLPFEKNSLGAHFDTQIIIQLRGAGFRIVEQPIPMARARELPLADSLKHAAAAIESVIDYELHEFGLQHHPEYVVPQMHSMKRGGLSSHSQILQLVGSAPRRILDVGCGPGELGHVLKQRGHYVFGVDWRSPDFELDGFARADIAQGLPSAIVDTFDVVLLADVLEHMIDPLKLLLDAKRRLSPRGVVLVSLPNAVHWSMRAQLFFGRFNYTNKGLLDRGHVRFFTRDSAIRLFNDAGFAVVARRTTPVPWENVLPRVLGSSIRERAEKADYLLTLVRPNLFAYQHLFELRLAPKA